MSKLTPDQISELENLLDKFDKYVESCIQGDQDYNESSVNNGEYKYLIKEGHEISDEKNLPEEIEEALDKSTITWKELVEWSVANDKFKMEYETLSNPHHYGGPEEMEFTTVQWNGERDVQIDLSNVEDLKPFFSLSCFESFESFSTFLREEIKRYDYEKAFYDFFVLNEKSATVSYNSDYDIVRVKLSTEEEILAYLKTKVKKLVFIPKKINITREEYNELHATHSGFCIFCGKINESFHEPDASEYHCPKCENNQSFGIEECIIRGSVEIVDNEDESDYLSALE